MSFVVPDLEWYTGRSGDLHRLPRCPFAAVEACPRYYQSLSLLGGAGSTPIDQQEDERLLKKWEESDLWPKTREQDTSIIRREGDAHQFRNFCPEVAFQRFGYFASYLGRYADEIDRNVAHAKLGNHSAARTDWRWVWASVEPQHYSDCQLFSVLSHRHNENEQRNAVGKEAAFRTVVNIGSIGTLGNLGDITDNAQVTIDQSFHYTQNDLTKITQLVTDILSQRRTLEPDLPAQRLIDLEACLQSVQEQLTQQSSDPSLIKSSLAAVKRILEGATANVVASGWLKVLEGLV